MYNGLLVLADDLMSDEYIIGQTFLMCLLNQLGLLATNENGLQTCKLLITDRLGLCLIPDLDTKESLQFAKLFCHPAFEQIK